MKRSYTMVARAEAVETTRQRIIDALFALSRDRMFPDISLDDVAGEAGVSVQTILRQFGSRAALIEAEIEYAIAQVREERNVPAGDIDAAMRVLSDHYEERGRTALLMLAQENADPQVARLTEKGRRMHRDWVMAVFAPFEPDDEMANLLIVATDVFTWRLLRLDGRLSQRATRDHMTRLVRAVLAGGRS
jgi:AcrR family transcriptional regulator